NYDSYLEGDLLSNYRHPAVDDRAKWELSSIFNVQFQKLNYMDAD
ncbi:24945_t:CDS:1, partial [Gigaspora rosea]